MEQQEMRDGSQQDSLSQREESRREEAIAELNSAIAELESENGLETFVEGHGLQSRYFRFSWDEPALEIDFRLPYARVLSDEDGQRTDEAWIGAACRLAVFLLTISGNKHLLSDSEKRLSVTADEFGERYELYGPDGEILDSDNGWDTLLAKFKGLFPENEENLQIIWP